MWFLIIVIGALMWAGLFSLVTVFHLPIIAIVTPFVVIAAYLVVNDLYWWKRLGPQDEEPYVLPRT